MRILRTLAALLLVAAAASACSEPPTAPAEPSIPIPQLAPSFEDVPAPPKP